MRRSRELAAIQAQREVERMKLEDQRRRIEAVGPDSPTHANSCVLRGPCLMRRWVWTQSSTQWGVLMLLSLSVELDTVRCGCVCCLPSPKHRGSCAVPLRAQENSGRHLHCKKDLA